MKSKVLLLFPTALLAFVAVLPISAQAIDAPIDVTATVEFDTVSIDWTAPAGADGVNVYADDTYLDTVTTGSMYQVLAAVPGLEVCYHVIAYEFVAGLPDFSEASEVVCATAGEPAPTEQCVAIVEAIGFPLNVEAFAQSGELGDEAGVSWDAVEGASGYNVFVNGLYETTVKGSESVVVPHVDGNLYSVSAFNDEVSPAVYGTTTEGVFAITVAE